MSRHRLPIYRDSTSAWRLIEADALAVIAKLPAGSVDAVVTDPPYGLGIGGEHWDGRDITRAVSAEEKLTAGQAFERWTTAWAAECRRVLKPGGHLLAFGAPRTFHRLAAGVEDAGLEIRDLLLWLHEQGVPKGRRLSAGLATSLKPAFEPVVLARAPLAGTTSQNHQRHGTGALDVQTTRVGEHYPANVALSHARGCLGRRCRPTCPVRLLDNQRPGRTSSRLFLCAKATRAEREAGCEQLPARNASVFNQRTGKPRRNIHPTVKPTELMRWLVRLVVPPDGVVLDPFAGSGSTGAAALLERRTFLGIEREGAYVDIACARLTHWAAHAAQEDVLP